MNADSPDIGRRKRKQPVRRAPAIIEERERKPFAFGWGADLDRRQREALKERIALYAGIAIAVIIVGLLGYGWYHDNVMQPAAIAARNNQIVAIVGNDTIHYGFFRKVALFQKKSLANNLTQLQQEAAQLSGGGKKDAAQLAQVNAQIQSIQAQQASLASNTLTTLLEDYTMLQRAGTVGVRVTPAQMNKQMTLEAERAGGKGYLNQYIHQNGLTYAQFEFLIKGNLLQSKLQTALAKKVSHYQPEVNARHILISAKDKPLAEKIYHKVLSGANFAALAKKYSTDKTTGKKGGDLGWAPTTNYVPAFAHALNTMKPGQTRLVKSQFGWHIVQELGRKTAKMTTLQYQQAQQQAFSNWIQKEEAQMHIQRVMDVTKIPGLSTTTSTGLSGLPSGITGSSQPPSSTLPSSGNPPSTGKAAGKSTTGKSTTGKSSSGKSSTGSNAKSSGKPSTTSKK